MNGPNIYTTQLTLRRDAKKDNININQRGRRTGEKAFPLEVCYLIHLADSEANAFVKCRKLIAEPGKSVMAYDQDIWSKALHYHDQSIEDALEVFKLLRLTTYKLIKSLPESVWSNAVGHMENESVTLDEWLELYEAHIPEHINQMRKNYDEWRKKHQ